MYVLIIKKPIQLKPCDITAMKKRPPSLPDFVLFGKNLGRGLTVTSSTHETALTVWNIKVSSCKHNIQSCAHCSCTVAQ